MLNFGSVVSWELEPPNLDAFVLRASGIKKTKLQKFASHPCTVAINSPGSPELHPKKLSFFGNQTFPP